jgi:hypothetical protein
VKAYIWPFPGEVWRHERFGVAIVTEWAGGVFMRTADACLHDPDASSVMGGWTRVLLANGEPPREVRRKYRIEGAMTTVNGIGYNDDVADMELAEFSVDADYPEDVP